VTVQRAVGADVRAALDRRRHVEDYLHEHRAVMKADGLACLPPVPPRLRAVLGDDEDVTDGQR
jgi:hypothetical protein